MSTTDSDEAPELVTARSSRPPSVHWSDNEGDLTSEDGSVHQSRLDGFGPSKSSKSSKGKRNWKDYIPGRSEGKKLKKRRKDQFDSDTEATNSGSNHDTASSSNRFTRRRSSQDSDSDQDSGYPDSDYENEQTKSRSKKRKSVSFSPTTNYSDSTRPDTTKFTTSPPSLVTSTFDNEDVNSQWPRLTEVKHHRNEQTGTTTTVIRFGEEDPDVDMDVGGLRIRYNRKAKAGGGNIHRLETCRADDSAPSESFGPPSKYQDSSPFTPPPSPQRSSPPPRPPPPDTSTTGSGPVTSNPPITSSASRSNPSTSSSIESSAPSFPADTPTRQTSPTSSNRSSTPSRTTTDLSKSSRQPSRQSRTKDTIDTEQESSVPLAYNGKRLNSWWTDLEGYEDLSDGEVSELFDERLATTAKSMRTIDDIYSFNNRTEDGRLDKQANRSDRFKAAQWLTDRLLKDKDTGLIEDSNTDIPTWIESTLDDLDEFIQESTDDDSSSLRQDGTESFRNLANWSLGYNPSNNSLRTWQGTSLAREMFDDTSTSSRFSELSGQDKRSHKLFEMFNTMDSLATHKDLRSKNATYTSIPDTDLSSMASEILDGGGDQEAFDHVLDSWYKESGRSRR